MVRSGRVGMSIPDHKTRLHVTLDKRLVAWLDT